MSTHAATPQSLLGKLQAIRQYTNPTGGINVCNVPVFPLTDFGFVKDALYVGQTPIGITVYQNLVGYRWLRDLAGIIEPATGGADLQSSGDLPALDFAGFLPIKVQAYGDLSILEENTQILGHDTAYTPGQGAVTPIFFQNIQSKSEMFSTQDYNVVLGWYNKQTPVYTGESTIFIIDSTGGYWTNKDYPFLPVPSAFSDMFVITDIGESIEQHEYEYDLSDGGLGGGGTTVIIVAGGGGGVSDITLRIKKNAWFKLQLTTPKGLSGYDTLPDAVHCDLVAGTIEGYLLTMTPVVSTFDLVGGGKLILSLLPYNIERRAN